MIKLLGVIAVVFSAGLIGIILSERLKKRAGELTLIGYLIEEISMLIRYKAMPVFEIADYLKRSRTGSQLDFINTLDGGGRSFSEAWGKSVETSGLSLLPSDRELLKSLGASLGTSDIQGQLSALELYRDSFKALEREASRSYEEKSRLFRSIGFLTGAFIAVMLI